MGSEDCLPTPGNLGVSIDRPKTISILSGSCSVQRAPCSNRLEGILMSKLPQKASTYHNGSTFRDGTVEHFTRIDGRFLICV